MYESILHNINQCILEKPLAIFIMQRFHLTSLQFHGDGNISSLLCDAFNLTNPSAPWMALGSKVRELWDRFRTFKLGQSHFNSGLDP